MSRFKPSTLLLAVSALAIAACTSTENVPGAAVAPKPTDPAAVQPGGALAPAASVGDAVTTICDLGRSDPRALVSLAAVNASDQVKRELEQQITILLDDLEPADPNAVLLVEFVGGEETNASDTCDALEPVKGGGDAEPAPITSGNSLIAAIESLGPDNTRANLSKIENACADQACRDELVEFKEFLESTCPSADDCADQQVALLLLHGAQPSEGQERLGICPVSGCPQTGLIIDRVEVFLNENPSESDADEPQKPAPDDEQVDQIILALTDAGDKPLTKTEIVDLVILDCPDCGETVDVLIVELVEATDDGRISDPAIVELAQALDAGQPVDPALVAAACELVRSTP
jgi:hypothetical protein